MDVETGNRVLVGSSVVVAVVGTHAVVRNKPPLVAALAIGLVSGVAFYASMRIANARKIEAAFLQAVLPPGA